MDFKDKAKISARNVLMRVFSFSKKKRNKAVFFISFSGKQYSDSPKAISEKLHEKAPNIQIIWMGNDAVKAALPEYVTFVQNSSVKALRWMAQSDVWVANTTLGRGTYKRRGILYIQTFHGDRGFKKCGYDAAQEMGKKYEKSDMHFVEEELCDIYMTGSVFAERFAKSALHYNGQTTKYGIPRNDVLMNISSNAEKAFAIREKLKISPQYKILLYAPTFRDTNRNKQDVNIDISEALNVLERDGSKWVCLLRGHSATKELSFGGEDSRILDVSDYMDMADILLISDILITDYSSSASDFILTNKPVILAQYDIVQFTKESRTLYFDPKDTGYLIAYNEEELKGILSNINSFDHESIRKKVDSFYGTHESGQSTEKICDYIISWLNKQ